MLHAIAVYLVLLVVFRLAGKRTLAQATPFDVVLLLIISEAVQNALVGDDRSLLILEAVQMALKARKPALGLIHHSDRGSQYASEKHVRVLENHGVQISMSRVGMATDDAKREQPASDQSDPSREVHG